MTNTPITVIGNLTADPELRFTPSGAAVANFRVASTPRKFDRATNEWVDGEAMFLACSVWRGQAEHVAESLTRGMRVIVVGKLKARSYTTSEGENRTVFEVDVDEVGPSLRYADAAVTKAPRSGGDWSAGGRPPARPEGSRREQRDPWTTPASGDLPPWPGVDQDDEPPF